MSHTPAADAPAAGTRGGVGAPRLPFLAPPPVAPASSLGKPPTFSVVVAAYQVADVIGEALESALAQTLSPLEVIVCDDGSTDNLERALQPYRERIVVARKDNGGESSAKNTAARLASGDFIAILDADDRYLPRRLEALAELACRRPDWTFSRPTRTWRRTEGSSDAATRKAGPSSRTTSSELFSSGTSSSGTPQSGVSSS
jgi:hypothetical protein